MISIARATEDSRYPTKHEVNAMAKRLVDYYPMIKDRSSNNEWEHVAKKLMKRLSNVRSPKVLLPRNHDKNQKIQARHYKTLQEIYKSKKPNKAAVTHLLNMEFESRRCFITSDVLKEQDRATKILEAYPCFRELGHVLDELQRIIQPTNSQYISEMQNRWKTFYSKVQFYGVMKKAMKTLKTLNGVEHITAVFRALPLLFPSSTLPPKKLGSSSEALFHILATTQKTHGLSTSNQCHAPSQKPTDKVTDVTPGFDTRLCGFHVCMSPVFSVQTCRRSWRVQAVINEGRGGAPGDGHQVIECLLHHFSNELHLGRMIYILNHYTAGVILFGKREQIRRNTLSKINFDNYKAIVSFVNIHNSHWKLLYINAAEKTVYLVDPARRSTELTDSDHAAKRLCEYFKLRRPCHSKTDWVDIKFKGGVLQHPLQQDGDSCGVLVIMMANAVMEAFPKIPNIAFGTTKTEMVHQRKHYALQILKASATKPPGPGPSFTDWIQCDRCSRWFHAQCLQMDTAQLQNVQTADWKCCLCDK
ncbi:unnamed protein product [Pleuronectes platessa]|uniref:Uncharacterized protein n=1 Tax=Pleuronectes platessa TaxID=8262 RepID=A0A9N7V0M8_PLEPL|nr:unnamed protein product [Pleuronectes platessa]